MLAIQSCTPFNKRKWGVRKKIKSISWLMPLMNMHRAVRCGCIRQIIDWTGRQHGERFSKKLRSLYLRWLGVCFKHVLPWRGYGSVESALFICLGCPERQTLKRYCPPWPSESGRGVWHAVFEYQCKHKSPSLSAGIKIWVKINTVRL